MKTKLLEIRDEGTCIPALAMRMRPETLAELIYFQRCGYTSGDGVVLMALRDQRATSDPYDWPAIGFGRRTMPSAHLFIIEHFDELEDGDVVDVRVILTESTVPADPEILTKEAKGNV